MCITNANFCAATHNRVVIGCGGPYGLSTAATVIPLGDALSTLGHNAVFSTLGCTTLLCIAGFACTVSAIKVTCFDACLLSHCRIASICLSMSISSFLKLPGPCFITNRKFFIALIIASAGVTTGCVRYQCWKKTVSEILFALVLVQKMLWHR